MKRRSFLTGLGAAAAAPLLLKVTGCDSGGGTTATTTGDGDGDIEPDGVRMYNTDDTHPHSFVLLCEDEGLEEVTYTAGGSAHTHRVTLTADQLDAVFAGEEVIIETNDSHPHTWQVMLPTEGCAGPAEPPPDGDTTDTLGGW